MPSIAEFLNARLDEDEAVAKKVQGRFPLPPSQHPDDYQLHVLDDDYKHDKILIDEDRVLAEVEAKRQIIAECVGVIDDADLDEASDRATVASMRGILKFLALPFAHHPDFDSDWQI